MLELERQLIPVGFAVTLPADVDPTIPEIWAKSVLREHKVAGFWRNMIGKEGSGMPIIQKTELLNKPGDLIHIGVTNPLSGTGVRGDERVLTGAEEKLTTSSIKVQPQNYAHAVRWNRRANKKNMVELRAEAKMRLAEWGRTLSDTERFRFFLSDGTSAVEGNVNQVPYAGEAYTPNKYIAGELGAENLITDSNGFLTVRDLQVIQVTLDDQKARPIRTVEGESVYVAVVSPNAAFNLKRDPEYQEYVKLARERAATNPLFTGALAMVDGIVVFAHRNVPRFVGGHVDAPNCMRGIAFGAEAFVEALDENVHSAVEDFDYGREFGISYEFAMRPRRALELSSLQIVASDQRTAS